MMSCVLCRMGFVNAPPGMMESFSHSAPMPGVSFSSIALRRATSKQLMMVNVSCDSCRLYR